MVVTFDVETLTKNKGNPFTASGKMISYGVAIGNGPAGFYYYDDLPFVQPLEDAFDNARMIVGFNLKFDLHWARRYGVRPTAGCRIWDCQIAEFLLRGQQGAYPSLNEALTRFSLGQKEDLIKEYWDAGIDTDAIPREELELYNKRDVDLTYQLYLKQFETMTPKQIRLCLLQGADLLVLADMEWNGVIFDVELCKKKERETSEALSKITEELRFLVGTEYFNFGSGHHLSCFLYGGAFEVTVPESTEQLIYKSGKRVGQEYTKTHWKTEVFEYPQLFKPLPRTETKLVSKVGDKVYPVYASGADVLKQLKKPTKTHRRVIDLLLEMAELSKLLDTYYGAIPALLEKMEWGDVLRGQYNQCVAATGRLSSSAPNMQNFSGDVDQLLVSRF